MKSSDRVRSDFGRIRILVSAGSPDPNNAAHRYWGRYRPSSRSFADRLDLDLDFDQAREMHSYLKALTHLTNA